MRYYAGLAKGQCSRWSGGGGGGGGGVCYSTSRARVLSARSRPEDCEQRSVREGWRGGVLFLINK